MPVIRTSEREMEAGNRPAWSTVTSAGRFTIPAEGARFDRHYHDCNEYWLIFAGKAKIMTEGKDHYIMPGDIVCIEKGVDHDILEIYETIEAFWFEEETPAGGRIGHLHRSEAEARGHDVPRKPLPEDFPR